MNLVMSKIIEFINKKIPRGQLEAHKKFKNNPNSFELNNYWQLVFSSKI